MRYVADTSVVVRLYDLNNPVYQAVGEALDILSDAGDELVIFPQMIVEFWTVATRPRDVNGLGMTTENADHEINQILSVFELVHDQAGIFKEWRRLVTTYKVRGKPTHDARIVAAMAVHDIENLLTLNPDDFKRFAEVRAVNPLDLIS